MAKGADMDSQSPRDATALLLTTQELEQLSEEEYLLLRALTYYFTPDELLLFTERDIELFLDIDNLPDISPEESQRIATFYLDRLRQKLGK